MGDAQVQGGMVQPQVQGLGDGQVGWGNQVAQGMFLTKEDLKTMVQDIASSLVSTQPLQQQQEIMSQSKLLQDTLAEKPEPRVSEPRMTDESWWLKIPQHDVVDNSGSVMDWSIRNHLRMPNVSPRKYSESMEAKVTPVRGQSLLLSHMLGSEPPNAQTIRQVHDLTAHTSVRSLLSRNNGVTNRLQKRLLVSEKGLAADTYSVGFDSGYAEPTSVYQVAEAISNLQIINAMIRPFSYHVHSFAR